MKSILSIAGFAVTGALVAGSASADPIPGTFVGAQADVNTFAQSDPGFDWAAVNNVGEWEDQSGNPGSFGGGYALNPADITSPTGTGGYLPYQSGDVPIVTTISGLTAGTQYEVYFIYSMQWGWTDSNMTAGFSPGGAAVVPGTSGAPFGSWNDERSLQFDTNSGYRVWDHLIGTTTADGNGEIDVYVGVQQGINYFRGPAYNGVSYVEVPEPGSLALLGLGGLALIRRRR